MHCVCRFTMVVLHNVVWSLELHRTHRQRHSRDGAFARPCPCPVCRHLPDHLDHPALSQARVHGLYGCVNAADAWYNKLIFVSNC